MKRVLLFLLLLLSITEFTAQPLAWVAPASGSGTSETTATVCDLDGNVITSGIFFGTITIGSSGAIQTLTSNGSSKSIFITKKNADGQILWAKSFGSQQDDSSTDIVIDLSGNIYCLGSFKSVLTLPQGANPSSLSPSGTEDSFILKISPSGSVQWALQLGGSDKCRGTAIATRGEELYIAGNFSGTVDFNPSSWTNSFTAASEFGDIFILKLTTSGAYQWLQRLQGPGDKKVSGIDIANNNRLWVTGYYNETLVPSSSGTNNMVESEGGKDIFIATYYFGQFSKLWTIGGPSDDVANDLATWKNSEDQMDYAVFITGTFQDSCNFKLSGFSSDYRHTVGSNDAFIFGMRSSPIVTYWVKTIGSTGNDEGLAVTADSNGNPFAGGRFENEITLSYLDGVVPYEAENLSDGFVHEFNNDGEFRSFKAFQGDQNTLVTGLAAAPDNAIHACGQFSGTANFDTFTTNHVFSAGSSFKHFNLKIDHCDELPTIIPASPCYQTTSPSGDFIWNESGGYLDFAPTFGGCNDAVYVELDLATSYDTIDVFVCDYYELPSGKDVIITNGTYNDTIPNHVGCDSVITSNVVILNPVIEECESQVLEWAQLSPYPPSYYTPIGFVIDNEENVYIGSGASSIGKYDSSGQFLSEFPIQNKHIATDGENYLFATHSYSSSNEFLIRKLTLEGELLWEKHFIGSVGSYSRIVADNAGNIILSGSFSGDVDFDPSESEYILSGPTESGQYAPFITKLNSNGELVFAKGLEAEKAVSRDLAVDASNNIYITGNFEGLIDCDPSANEHIIESYLHPQTLDYRNHTFICKFNASGELQWAKSYGGTSWDGTNSYAIAVDSVGNVHTTGYFGGVVNFNPMSEDDSYDPWSTAIFINKLSTEGDHVWTSVLTSMAVGSGSTTYDIALDKEGNVYTTGDFGGVLDFNPGEGVNEHWNSSGSSTHAFLSKLNSSGDYVWAKHFITPGFSKGRGVAVSDNMNVYFAGHKTTNAPVNFLKGQGNYWIGEGEYSSGLLAKFQPCHKNTSFQEISVCDSLISDNGEVWSDDGVYSILQENSDGCDSLNIYHLNVSSSNDTLDVYACDSYTWNANGETYTNHGLHSQSLTNSIGCDSIVTIDLQIEQSTFGFSSITDCETYFSPSGNYSWNQSGIYTDTISNAAGCDSILTIDLTINPESSSAHNVVSCFSYTPPSENAVWLETGEYVDVIPNTAGCDSIMTFNVLIKNINYSLIQNGPNLTILSPDNIDVQWVKCSNGLEILSADSGFNFTAYANGDYGAIIEYNGCVDTTDCYQITGIVEPDLESVVLLYPNPTSNSVTIDLFHVFNETTVELFNALGQKLGEHSFNSERYLHLEMPFARGVYYLNIVTDTKKNAVLRVVKMD